jgi:hypothetical protein
MPNGKVERRAFSDTPLTDAVTNASIGLDSLGLGGGPGLAMTAGAMGAGATNTRGGSMIAQAVKPPGSDTADPNSVASQAKAATSSVANTPMPITSAVKQAATGAAGDLTFAGLDPNLSEDEKAKKRGEMLAAKYKPQL